MSGSGRTTAPSPRLARRLLTRGLAAAALALAASACTGATTSREGADLERGKQIFTDKCGSCHVLADAGTQGEVGPNLDHAFGYARKQNFEDSTFFEITLDQLEIAAPPMPTGQELGVTGEDAVNVAAYIADVAGKPPKQAAGPEVTGGKEIFNAFGCGSCHTLADAGTSGTVGPNLDQLKPDLEGALAQISDGGGGMPAYAGRLTEQQIENVAQYVVRVAGG